MLNNRKLKRNYVSRSHLTNSSTTKLKKPNWIRVKAPISTGYLSTKELITKANLNTKPRIFLLKLVFLTNCI